MKAKKVLEIVTKIIDRPDLFTKEEAREMVEQSNPREVEIAVREYLKNKCFSEPMRSLSVDELISRLLTDYEDALFLNVGLSIISTSVGIVKVFSTASPVEEQEKDGILSKAKTYNEVPI